MPRSKQSPKEHKRMMCPQRERCVLIRTGNCPHTHPLCYKGITCLHLRKRNCCYYHPKKHYEIINSDNKLMNKLIETSSKDDNNNILEYTVDDDSLINAIHPVKKPDRYHKPWEKWEDEKLVKFINESTNVKDPKVVKQFSNEFQRTESGILVRIQKIKNTKKTKQANKAKKLKSKNNKNNKKNDNNLSSESSDDSSTDVSDSNSGSPFLIKDDKSEKTDKSNIGKSDKPITKKCPSVDSGIILNKIDKDIMNVLEDLKLYYKKIKNGFEVRSVSNLIARINESKWKNMTELEGIIGCDITYFKSKLNTMKQKYGIIDKEMKIKTMNVLENVKSLCKNEVENIDNIINKINENYWLGDMNEFEKITNYKFSYFENIKTVMNGTKIGGENMNGNDNENVNVNEDALDDILDGTNDKNDKRETFLEKRRIRGCSVDSVHSRAGNNNHQRNYNSYNRNNRNKFYRGGYNNRYNDRKRNRSYKNDQFYPNSKRTKYTHT